LSVNHEYRHAWETSEIPREEKNPAHFSTKKMPHSDAKPNHKEQCMCYTEQERKLLATNLDPTRLGLAVVSEKRRREESLRENLRKNDSLSCFLQREEGSYLVEIITLREAGQGGTLLTHLSDALHEKEGEDY